MKQYVKLLPFPLFTYMIIATMTALVYATNSPWIHVCLGFLPFFFHTRTACSYIDVDTSLLGNKKACTDQFDREADQCSGLCIYCWCDRGGASSLQNQLWNLYLRLCWLVCFRQGYMQWPGSGRQNKKKGLKESFYMFFLPFYW